ncbi:MAG: hypothetical protein PHH16_00070 [Candidatus Gracilibacteria bacterium]|nr:hypothetical protein [Candidatus Gracilibacteria bacterium]
MIANISAFNVAQVMENLYTFLQWINTQGILSPFFQVGGRLIGAEGSGENGAMLARIDIEIPHKKKMMNVKEQLLYFTVMNK